MLYHYNFLICIIIFAVITEFRSVITLYALNINISIAWFHYLNVSTSGVSLKIFLLYKRTSSNFNKVLLYKRTSIFFNLNIAWLLNWRDNLLLLFKGNSRYCAQILEVYLIFTHKYLLKLLEWVELSFFDSCSTISSTWSFRTTWWIHKYDVSLFTFPHLLRIKS